MGKWDHIIWNVTFTHVCLSEIRSSQLSTVLVTVCTFTELAEPRVLATHRHSVHTQSSANPPVPGGHGTVLQ